ncbi:MAG: Uncharacterised protein [Owenweeksia sp. TMED14]|nr:MAG: Uncharacterised protein [Owenweeksia sp. TMED14]|tara:strand:+ start:1293 stop:2147 length:855 start_codon:yes stop_codon:yes gene_type:complete
MLVRVLLVLFGLFFSFDTFSQNIPVDFEQGGFGASWNWKVFENGQNSPLEIVPNPDTTGINKSLTVAKFNALSIGAPWAGCETFHGLDIGSFMIDQTNMVIRVMVYKSVISDVGIKLVRSDNWSLGEIKVSNTKVNEWEQLTFDFSSHFGLPYDQLVFFPDFTSRQLDNVIYFDNVFDVEYLALSDCPATPLDFEMSLPNVFSPNNDGLNDFYFPLVNNVDWIEWEVFSRNGQKLFQSTSLTEKWDGTQFGKKLPEGVYFIFAKCGSDQTGNLEQKQSSIHLTR